MVKDLRFFADFNEPEMWEVINASAWYTYDPGTEIITEGEIDNSFYIVISGEAQVLKGDKAVDHLHSGDCFGEMGFISAGKVRTASIIAKTTLTAMRVRASLIDRASLQCQLRFHKVFLTTLVERLTQTTEHVSTDRSVSKSG